MFEIGKLDVIRFGRQVIAGLDLAVPHPGSLALIGPGGAGKSSLLLATAGGDKSAGGMQMAGQITLDGQPTQALGDALGWFPQWHDVPTGQPSALRATRRSEEEKRAFSQERLRCLADFLATRRLLYVLDEPTAQLTEEDACRAREMISALTADAFVLIATHNRQDCLALDGHMAILAEGSIREAGPTRELLSRPQTEDGRRWLETGYVVRSTQPQQGGASDGVWWAVPGLLCGLSRPGLIAPAERQYQHLANNGVRHLVCLEEVELTPDVDCAPFGIARHLVPMPDMSAPSVDQATAFCQMAEEAIARNEGVAFHCKGGLGRTGTAIAAVLICHGDSAHTAIEKVRCAQYLAIQSREQLDFLHAFAQHLHDGAALTPPATH